MGNREVALQSEILRIRVGSHLYGLNTPDSDEDFSGIFMPPREVVFGFEKCDEVDFSVVDKDDAGKNTKDAVDLKLYNIQKFVKLAMENNPNIIEQLFVPYEKEFPFDGLYDNTYVKFMSLEGEQLLESRHLFPHKGCSKKFLGYAFSQKKKMIIRTDKFHELNTAYEYFSNCSLDKTLMIAEIKNNMLPFINYNGKFATIGDLNFEKHKQLRHVEKALKERLDKVGNRKDLYLKHSYDTKFGSHLIRLLIEGKELLETGELKFPLTGKNKDDIMDIKLGKWKINEVIEYSDQLESEYNQLIEKSDLTSKPQYDKIQQLLMDMIEEWFYS